jgi:hypothetical protein
VERCGFFDANLVGEEYDRVYLASQFAAYFASFIGNGVFAEHSNQLQVVEMETPQMQIGVEKGQAWINGYWYENTDILYLPIDIADGVLNRIDSVVLRLGFSERNIWLAVKKGTPAINPIAPEVTRTADYYELQLATISIPAGSIKITQAQITDTRMNQDVCGWVTGVVEQLDTTTLFNQYVSWYTATTGQAETDIEAIKQQFQDDINQFLQDWYDWFINITGEKEEEFDTWFNGIKDVLNESTAGNLLNLIENHKNDKNNPHNVTTEQIGAETPAGAQAKADATLNLAKQYTDQITGLTEKETIFNIDGSITETRFDGSTLVTVFNADGSITETLTKGEIVTVKTTTFNPDGSISEVIV